MCELPRQLWEDVDEAVAEIFARSDEAIHDIFNRILLDTKEVEAVE